MLVYYQTNGHNKLEGTIARLCKQAGIPGHRTNHSLHATAVTRLYQSGIDEQLVMERTGHRSLDGVGGYKHTSMAQKEALSDILNCQSQMNSHSLVSLSSNTASHLPLFLVALRSVATRRVLPWQSLSSYFTACHTSTFCNLAASAEV